MRCYGKPAQNAGRGRWRTGGMQRTLSMFIESNSMRICLRLKKPCRKIVWILSLKAVSRCSQNHTGLEIKNRFKAKQGSSQRGSPILFVYKGVGTLP